MSLRTKGVETTIEKINQKNLSLVVPTPIIFGHNVKMTGKRPERAINSSPGQTSPRWLSGRVSPWGKCTRSRIVRGRIFFNEPLSLRTKHETFSKFVKFVQFMDQYIHLFRSIRAGSLKGSCDFSPGQVSPRWLSGRTSPRVSSQRAEIVRGRIFFNE